MACLCVWSVAHAQSIKPIENVRPTTPQITTVLEPTPLPKITGVGTKVRVTGTPIRATKQISPDLLRQYLETKHSPLSSYVEEILSSEYWSTIIGICTIEEYSCSHNPFGSNNLWGIMCSGHICSYPTMEAGLAAINSFLEKAESNGRTTVESFRGWYCQSECSTWQSTVIDIKLQLENL